MVRLMCYENQAPILVIKIELNERGPLQAYVTFYCCSINKGTSYKSVLWPQTNVAVT